MSWEDRNLTGLENLAILQFCAENNCTPDAIHDVKIDSNMNGEIKAVITLSQEMEVASCKVTLKP